MVRIASIGLCWSALLLIPSLAAAQARLPTALQQQFEALMAEKAARGPAERKVHSQLLWAARATRGQPGVRGIPQLENGLRADARGGILLDVRAAPVEQAAAEVVRLGGTVLGAYPQYDALRAWLPLRAVLDLASLAAVQRVRPADPGFTRKVDTSEGDVAHKADLARAAFGVAGAGIGVGVLSDSVDFLSQVVASGDVSPVTVLTGQAGSGSGEGTAMLEIVHDLAPNAPLFFATGFNGPPGMAANIVALRSAGCDVIADDIGYFLEPAFQDGVIAQAIEQVSAAGALYLSAAGNDGNLDDATSSVWEGDFFNSGISITYGGKTLQLHAFDGKTAPAPPPLPGNTIVVDPPGLMTLQWADPMGASGNDYDLLLVNASNQVLAASTDVQNGNDDPIEWIDSGSFNDTGLRLVVAKRSTAQARFLRLDLFGGTPAFATAGQVFGHAAAASAVAVAAVDAQGATQPFTGGAANPIETFSSDGPRRIFYLANGTPITAGNFSSTGGTLRQKPDLTAADGVMTSTPGFNPFFGTSAAAPHAAAIAALVWSANPLLTAAAVRQALTTTALDIEGPGVDRDAGAGIADALAAVQSVFTGASPTPTGTPSPSASVAPTATASPTATRTGTATPTPTPSQSPTASASKTFSASPTPSSSPTSPPSPTPSTTPSASPTATPSLAPSVTSTPTPSSSPSATIPPTATASFTSTPTPTPSTTPSLSPTPTNTATASATPSSSPTSSPSATSSPTPTRTITATPSDAPSITPTTTTTPTRTPSATPTITATPSDTPSSTPTTTTTPTRTPSATPTITNSPTPSRSASPTSTATSTRSATATASATIPATSTPAPVLSLDPIALPITIGGTNTLTGSGFTPGSVIVLFINELTGPDAFGPFAPLTQSATSLQWQPPASVPLGNGFGTVVVVNTDQGFTQSNPQSQDVVGAADAGLATILAIDGVALRAPEAGVPVANVETVVVQGEVATLTGSGFVNPLINLFTLTGNVGPLVPLPGATSTQLTVTVPLGAPTGPGAFQVVNVPSFVPSNAVSVVLGERLTITGVTQAGTTVTVSGTGFCSATIINLFNQQGGGVVNLGGLGPGGALIPLTVTSSSQFTFEVPAGAVPGPAYLQAINPPFIPFSSTGGDPHGAFTLQ